jgi:protein-tyrosine phosphatase
MKNDRIVPFDACFNFRDLGGYETADGRHVRWGAVFRSDTLHRLTTADRHRALALGVRTVIDLRSIGELERNGGFPRADEVTFHHLPLEEEIPRDPPHPETPEPPPGEIYTEIATAGKTSAARVLRVIAEGEHAVVFHCASGKDRTGIIAALLLSALGVPDATIVADYHLTERSLGPAVAWAEANEPQLAELLARFPPWMLRAPTATMHAFLDSLRDRHGSIEGYLVDAGLEAEVVEVLRARLLVD